MTPVEILNKYDALGVRLWANEGQLHFKAPANTLEQEHIAELRAIKDELLSYLEDIENISFTSSPEERHEPFPLTDIQAAYLVGRTDSYDFGGVGCHGYVELSLPEMDHSRLEKAWRAVVDRHDMLRAVVSTEGVQQVLEEVPVPSIEFQDLKGLAPGEVKERVLAVRQQLSTKQYAPNEYPLCELALSTTDEGSILHCSIDMLIADFVSVDIMLSELDQLYHAPETLLPEPEITFRDVILFQRKQQELPSQVAHRERDKQYWLDRLDTLPEGPDLPVWGGKQGGAVSFTRHGIVLEAEHWQRFTENAKKNRLTPSCAVLAVFAETIGRWACQPSFCINITLLNRPASHPQVNRIIGDFTAVNVLEVSTGEEKAFSERAKIIQDRLWEDMEHTSFSGVEVLREISRSRDTRAVYPVVFTSMLGLGDEPREDGEFMRDARLTYGISQTPQVWIDCQASEREGRLHLNWDVRDGVFPAGLVEDAFKSFKDLLRRLAEEQDVWDRITPLSLPPNVVASRDAVNHTAKALPEGVLHSGFYETLRRTPQKRALVSNGQDFTYADLGARVVAVQKALLEGGCGPDSLVAVIQPKSVMQVASVLGVLFAGGAYLPIDMNEPPARRNAILENAGVRIALVLGPDGDTEDFPETVRCVDVDALELGNPELLQPRPKNADELAYVIYTSGTTGTPKGVMMDHRAVVNTVADLNARFDVTEKDVVLGVANLNFDLSVYDIFGTFAAGGTLVLPDESSRSDPGHWADLMFAHDVTLWNSVPAQLHMLLTFLEGEAPLEKAPGLRVAMLSGDWIPPALPATLRSYCPDILVMSLGGATEAAIWSIGYEIPRDLGEVASIPYGTPLANQTFHVLDGRLQPCPNWVTGHLYIGGAGLALGYLGDEERTAERFIVHPESGERLYKTGDLGRYRPDGVIEFLGRDDTQVKIRGHRIELGEVESVIQGHPAVATAVAMIVGDTPQQYKLAAFAEACPHAEATVPESVTVLGKNCRKAGDEATKAVDRELLTRWIDLLDQTSFLGMIGALRVLGLFGNMESSHSYEEIIELGGISSKNHRLLRRWLAVLCEKKFLALDKSAGRYSLAATPPDEKALPACWKALEQVEAELHYGQDLIDYLRLSSDHLPELLQGQADPLELLFPEGSLETALGAYNDNLVSRSLNAVIKKSVGTLAEMRRENSGRPLRVLEVGAGVGGTTRDLIEYLDDYPVEYHFTDVSTFFLNEAKEIFSAYPWVSYGLFDINTPYWEQGVAAGTFDVIICANVLHNSLHAPTVLESLKEVAAPGGVLMVIEAVGTLYSLLTSMEFKEGLTGFTDVRAETGQTFFTCDQWLEMFADAGAQVVGQYPMPDDALFKAGQAAFITRFAPTRMPLSVEELTDFVGERLPKHMVPTHVEILPGIPLSANGKIDRKNLAKRVGQVELSTANSGEAPCEGLERQIAEIWLAALNRKSIGRKEDFFVAGGDSLLIAQVVAKMRETLPEAKEWEWDRLMREVLQEPTVAAVAIKLKSDERSTRTTAEDDFTLAGSPLSILAPGKQEQAPMTVLFHTGNGNLAPYRHLLPMVIGTPGRTHAIGGLSVSDIDGFLKIPEARLIEELGRQYAQAIMDSGASRVELIGYCIGGLIALECAHVLLESGVDIAPLTIVSSGPFQYSVRDEMLMERAFGRLLGADVLKAGHFADEELLGRAINRHLGSDVEVLEPGFLESQRGEFAAIRDCYVNLARKEQPQRLADIAAALPNAEGEVSEYQVGVTQLLYKVFKHSFGAVAQYNPMPLLHDIRLFHAKDTSLHAIPGVQSAIVPFWQDITIGELTVIDVEGDHMSCMQPPHVAGIAKILVQGGK